uniref:Uncharacterized protein n=1 Tax=Arundo donax TaxID=35708 RepID=A0A0A9B7J3_ARUDO
MSNFCWVRSAGCLIY